MRSVIQEGNYKRYLIKYAPYFAGREVEEIFDDILACDIGGRKFNRRRWDAKAMQRQIKDMDYQEAIETCGAYAAYAEARGFSKAHIKAVLGGSR
jgi:hypothetical protein